MGTVNSSQAHRSGQLPDWYRSRKPRRALTVIVALSIAAVLVWVSALNRPDSTTDSATGCQSAQHTTAAGSPITAAAFTTGEHLPATGLDTVPPSPPQQVSVQVLNANGQPGEATTVATGLARLGFDPAAAPANDPLHPAFDLRCPGEIRFGPAGQAAARTLSLAVPCAELVRDGRPGAAVDLALGTEFSALHPTDAARRALQGLTRLGQPQLISQGGQAAVAAVPDPDLLRQARQAAC